MVEQGGISINEEKVISITRTISCDDLEKGFAILKKGKKQFIKLVK